MEGYSVYISGGLLVLCVCVFGIIRQAGQGLIDLLRTPQVEHFLLNTNVRACRKASLQAWSTEKGTYNAHTTYHWHTSFAWFI